MTTLFKKCRSSGVTMLKASIRNTEFYWPRVLAQRLNVRDILYCASEFDAGLYSDSLFSTYGEAFPKQLSQAVVLRKAEFLCGRQTAKLALHQLGSKTGMVTIGENRSPVFPKGIVGSISHSQNLAICAVALQSNIEYVGVDLEHIIAPHVLDDIEKQIITTAEKRIIVECGLNIGTGFTVVYSAKESLFKALHGNVGAYFDFDAAKMIEINLRERRITFELAQTLSPQLPAGTRVSGLFYVDNDYVLTLIYKHRT